MLVYFYTYCYSHLFPAVGQWSISSFLTVIDPNLMCPELRPAPMNGELSYNSVDGETNNRVVNTVATYTCNPGYMLTGEATRLCLANAKWSGSEQTCPRMLPNDLLCVVIVQPHPFSCLLW